MIDLKALANALRCSASNYYVPCKQECPYCVLEKIDEGIGIPADITINGVGYYLNCDVDRMAMDAAEIIEKNIK